MDDPDSDPRCELVYLDTHLVYYGLVGFHPEEVGLEDYPDLRWYAVWSVTGQDPLVFSGVHWGREVDAYSAIRGVHRGSWKELKWHRYDSKAAAQEAFKAEAHRFGLPDNYSERVIGWIRKGP